MHAPEALERSRARVTDLLQRMPGGLEAVQEAIKTSRIDPDRFDIQGAAFNDATERANNPFGLEAIIRKVGRPPMLIVNDQVEIEPLPLLPEVQTKDIVAIHPFIPSVGRIEFINHAMSWGGTGFVVDEKPGGKRLVLTNRHVAAIVARRGLNGEGIFLRSPIGPRYGAKIDMREEHGSPSTPASEHKVVQIVYLADLAEPDVALLEISVDPNHAPYPIPLASTPAKDGEPVATIGYPAFDSRNDLSDMQRYFGNIYDVKRFAPGLIIKMAGGDILSHDCTTLGGNSGSCLISLQQKAVVGLHFAGEYGVGNAAVGVETIKRLLSGHLFALKPSNIAASDMEKKDGANKAEHFEDRKGYDPGFLGRSKATAVPWPEFDDAIARDLAKPSDATDDRPFELRYTNFGVLYSKSRKSPRVTAVNIDGKKSRRIKRGDDQWFFDLRIDRSIQLGSKQFADPEIDRGHMVRREDPNWGPDAQQANDDTFHYTNAALQHSTLNQSQRFWRGLEDYILDSARTKGFKASVFTGPVFRDDDPDLPEAGTQVPQEFWKIAVMRAADGGLHATGYILSQGQLIRDLLEKRKRTEMAEGFALGPYRTFQVAISAISAVTGFRFPGLVMADPLARRAAKERPEDEFPSYVYIDDLSAIEL